MSPIIVGAPAWQVIPYSRGGVQKGEQIWTIIRQQVGKRVAISALSHFCCVFANRGFCRGGRFKPPRQTQAKTHEQLKAQLKVRRRAEPNLVLNTGAERRREPGVRPSSGRVDGSAADSTVRWKIQPEKAEQESKWQPGESSPLFWHGECSSFLGGSYVVGSKATIDNRGS